MQRGRRGEEVLRVAVSQERPGPEGKWPTVVQGGWLSHLRVLLQHGRLLALLVLVGDLSVSCLNAVLLHGERPVHLGNERSWIPLEYASHVCCFYVNTSRDSRCAV